MNKAIVYRFPLFSMFCITIILYAQLDECIADTVSRKNSKANRLYKKCNYDKALKTYQDAQLEAPQLAELHYNIGNTHYKNNQFDDAKQAFQQALQSDSPDLKQKAYYNLGNTDFRAGEQLISMGNQSGMERIKEAVAAYKQALTLRSDDKDTKHNLEFALKRLKELERENKNKDNKNQQNKDQKQNKDQQNKDQSDNDQNKKQQDQNKDNQQQKSEKKDKPQDSKQPQKQPQKKQGMSQEDARRILDALKEDEKDIQKKLRKMQPVGAIKIQKDW